MCFYCEGCSSFPLSQTFIIPASSTVYVCNMMNIVVPLARLIEMLTFYEIYMLYFHLLAAAAANHNNNNNNNTNMMGMESNRDNSDDRMTG